MITISRVAYSDITRHGCRPHVQNAWGILLGAEQPHLVQVALPVDIRRYLARRAPDVGSLQESWERARPIAAASELVLSGWYYSDLGVESDYDAEVARRALAHFEWLPPSTFVLLRYLFGGETFWDPEVVIRDANGWNAAEWQITSRRSGVGAIHPRRVRAAWRQVQV